MNVNGATFSFLCLHEESIAMPLWYHIMAACKDAGELHMNNKGKSSSSSKSWYLVFRINLEMLYMTLGRNDLLTVKPSQVLILQASSKPQMTF